MENERNIHYLHPDFEEDNENKDKKLSPLALLAKTCQSIGSGIKEIKSSINRNKSCSPNSTSTGTRRSFKRSNSDYLSNSSNSPSVDKSCSPPLKKSHQTTEQDHNKPSRVELTHADTSSDLGKEINQSLMNSFMSFLKNSNNSQQSYADKLEFLYFLTSRFMTPEYNPISDKPEDISNFNISNGFPFKNQAMESTKLPEKNPNPIPLSNPMGNIEPNCYEKLGSLIEKTQKSGLTIKYCMYCGKLIPLLPMLLAHIRVDHINEQFSDRTMQNFNTQLTPSLCEFLAKFNAYNLSNPIKSNQSPSVPTFANYINNWSNLVGYENLIFLKND